MSEQNKLDFVRTFLTYKQTERLNGRISTEERETIKQMFPGKSEMFVIRSALAEYFYNCGGRFIPEWDNEYNLTGRKLFQICNQPYRKK